jgi:predicted permease
MRDRDADLRTEIQSHRDMATADRIARGATPDEAAAAARRELGNLSQIQEATRDVWGRRWLEQAGQDLRYALRTLRHNPAFALVAILSLTLGIGANTALFEVVNAVRLRTLPVADPAGLVEVRFVNRDGARGNFQTWFSSMTQPIWRELAARQGAFDGLFAWSRESFNLSEGGEVRQAEGLWASGQFFTTLGVQPAAGRLLTSSDDTAGCPARAVLGEGFWRRAYNGDPSVVGRTLVLDSRRVEIVGVAPRGFYGLEVGRAFDVVLPLCAEPLFSEDGQGRANAGTTWWLGVFGRLKPGWSIDRASAHVAALSPAILRASLPPTYPPASVDRYLRFRLGAYPGGAGLSQIRQDYESPLWLLLGIAGVVLIIACANLANLLLARATARERELGIRLGLGASRGRVIRQLLTESLLLVSIGTAGALLVAGALGQWLIAMVATSGETIVLPLGVDARVLLFAVALALGTCLLFGLAPAIRGTRVAARTVLREGPRGATAGRQPMTFRRALVVVQIALSLALLFDALLFARTLRNVLRVNPGFKADGLIMVEVNMTALNVPADQRAQARQAVVDRMRVAPGIESASTVSVVPISGSSGGNDFWPAGSSAGRFNASTNSVGDRYFATLEVPFRAGRDFDQRDTNSSTPVAIVNETMAARLGGTIAAVGQRVTREATPGTPETTFEVIGVVRDSIYRALKEEPEPVIYFADSQRRVSPYVRMLVRSSVPVAGATSSLTAALARYDPRIVVKYTPLPTMIRDTLAQDRLLAGLSGGFGILAALLTIVGLYGLITYTVTRRTGEIGVRMALGATAPDVARLLLRETGALLAIGTTCGLALAVLGGRFAATLLFGVKPYDLATLSAATLLLAVIAILATFGPARRAMRIDPMAALRAE